MPSASPSPSSAASAAAAREEGALAKAELHRLVGARLSVPAESVGYVLEQVRHGATVPFLARYRKDETGRLDEDVLRHVMDTAAEVTEVHRRRQFMLKSLEQRGLLTAGLRSALARMVHLSQLEDAWEPYKERKTSLASRGREAGLGPTAAALLHTTDPVPQLRETLRRVEDGERLFAAILAEELQRCEEARQRMLGYCRDTTTIRSEVIAKARKKRAKEMEDNEFDMLKKKFAHYDGKSWLVRHVRSHALLALMRGEEKGVLKVEFVAGDRSHSIFMAPLHAHFPGLTARLSEQRAPGSTDYERRMLRAATQAAYEHLLKAAHNTIKRDLRKSAEQDAIAVFAHNLKHMLLQRPLSHARLLAMDPGLANGVKCVGLDEGGAVLLHFTCTLMDDAKMRAFIVKAVEGKQLNRIVIGNGTASQRTAELVASVIKERRWETVEFAVVSEAGASVYSVSNIAKEEFPTLDIMYRGAVSIGRRVLDPLSELVKIPVRSMGIGMYQHDVNEKELTRELDRVVESCVAKVGVNAGSAHRYVIEKVSGVSGKLADQIVLARHSRRLSSRAELRQVPGMSDAVYQQVAGFFRFPNSPEVLDNTNIHPESYPLAKQLLMLHRRGELPDSTAATDSDGDERKRVGELLLALPEADLSLVASRLSCGVNTLRLVAEELRHPALDPRASLSHAGFLRKEIRHAKDLKPGDELDGVVLSVTPFGAFVDCGLHDSVLVRGRDTDRMQVGMLLERIVFKQLDQMGRPMVNYSGGALSSQQEVPHRHSLRLEAEDLLGTTDGLLAALPSTHHQQKQVLPPLPASLVGRVGVKRMRIDEEGSTSSRESLGPKRAADGAPVRRRGRPRKESLTTEVAKAIKQPRQRSTTTAVAPPHSRDSGGTKEDDDESFWL